MEIFLVYDHIDYTSSDVIAVFDNEDSAREFARSADLFCDGRSIVRAMLNNPNFYPEQITYKTRDKKGEF